MRRRSTPDHPHALTYLTIDAAAGSSLTVVQVVRGDAEGGVSANLTRIRAAEGAHVVLVQVQLLGNRARRWNAVAIEQGTSARVEQVRIELGRLRCRLRCPHAAEPQQVRVRSRCRLLRPRQ